MKKLLLILLLIPSLSSASLSNTTSAGFISHGAGAGIDNLSTYTTIMWVNPISLTASRAYWDKTSASAPIGRRRMTAAGAGSEDEITVTFRRDALASYTTNNANITVNKWWFIAVSFDVAGSAGDLVRVYRGDLTSLARPTTFGASGDSTGALVADANGSWSTGSISGGASGWQAGRYAVVGHWNRRLSQGEIWAQQFFPHCTAGVIFLTIYNIPAGTQRNICGKNFNGTVTSMIQNVGVPIANTFGR